MTAKFHPFPSPFCHFGTGLIAGNPLPNCYLFHHIKTDLEIRV